MGFRAFMGPKLFMGFMAKIPSAPHLPTHLPPHLPPPSARVRERNGNTRRAPAAHRGRFLLAPLPPASLHRVGPPKRIGPPLRHTASWHAPGWHTPRGTPPRAKPPNGIPPPKGGEALEACQGSAGMLPAYPPPPTSAPRPLPPPPLPLCGAPGAGPWPGRAWENGQLSPLAQNPDCMKKRHGLLLLLPLALLLLLLWKLLLLRFLAPPLPPCL